MREAIALAGEIVSKSQIAAQAQETVNVSTFLWFLVFLLLYGMREDDSYLCLFLLVTL